MQPAAGLQNPSLNGCEAKLYLAEFHGLIRISPDFEENLPSKGRNSV
jgi:hypothetical protein